jgi:AcrR family transcriptional regulator
VQTDDVLKHSGAPRGSVYHHFPGGREQLLRDATDFASEYVARRLERGGGDGPLAAIEALYHWYRECLVESDFRAGCPVVAVAVESPRARGGSASSPSSADVLPWPVNTGETDTMRQWISRRRPYPATGTPLAAVSVRFTTLCGWETMATWLLGTSTVLAPMRLANMRSTSGGMA